MARDRKPGKQARTPRLWIDVPLTVDAATSIELPGRAVHHLLTVLRAGDGTTVELFNGDGNTYRAVLHKDGKKLRATVESLDANVSESPLTSTLVQSISRGDRMDTSVQKCVELGVNRIQPVYTAHSIPRLKGDRANKKLEHWQAVAISAAEQSARSVVPVVLPACTLDEWLRTHWQEHIDAGAMGWVLDPMSGSALDTARLNADHEQFFIIGPETGLEPNEIASACEAGFTAIRFGHRILRTETAGPAMLTALQTLAGDLLA